MEENITFKIPSMEDYEKIKDFMYSAYFPDEPIFRSTNVLDGNGFMGKSLKKEIEKMYIEAGLKDKTSMMVVDQDGEILGCR